MRSAAIAICLLMTAGCQGDGKNEVRGKVTYAGSPVEEGYITFQPQGKEGRQEGAPIKGGAYSLRVLPATYKVEIMGQREKLDPVVKMTTKEQYLPAVYNTKTTLTANVAGSAEVNFHLEKK